MYILVYINYPKELTVKIVTIECTGERYRWNKNGKILITVKLGGGGHRGSFFSPVHFVGFGNVP